MAVGGGRAHHQVTFAVLSLGVAAFALLQSLVVPVLTTVQHLGGTVEPASRSSERPGYRSRIRSAGARAQPAMGAARLGF